MVNETFKLEVYQKNSKDAVQMDDADIHSL